MLMEEWDSIGWPPDDRGEESDGITALRLDNADN